MKTTEGKRVRGGSHEDRGEKWRLCMTETKVGGEGCERRMWKGKSRDSGEIL